MSRTQKDRKLEEVYSQIPKSVCEADCGRCCGLVWPSEAEVRNIRTWCAVHKVEYRDFLAIDGQGNCPYLSEEKKCIIYQVRPLLCRLLGVSIDLPCPVGKCRGGRLLNSRQSDALYGVIYLRGKQKARTEKHRTIVKRILSDV